MQRAFVSMPSSGQITQLKIDGHQIPPQLNASRHRALEAIVKGDSLDHNIAAASIIAKVARDRVMAAWHKYFPWYDLASNAGYGTAKHMAALAQYGACPLHRRSFAPVQKVLAQGLVQPDVVAI